MNFQDVAWTISDISEISEWLPYLLMVLRGNLPQHWRVLKIYFLLSASIKIFTLITAEMKIHNMPAFHLLSVVEVCFIYVFYNKVSFKFKYYWLTVIILIVLNILDSLMLEPVTQFNAYGWSFNTLFLMGCGLTYLYNLYEQTEDTPLENIPEFIVTIGLLVYLSGSLLTYVNGWSILSAEDKNFFHNAWIIQSVSNIFKNLIVCYGVWRVK